MINIIFDKTDLTEEILKNKTLRIFFTRLGRFGKFSLVEKRDEICYY